MAKTLKDDVERDRRINLVGNLFVRGNSVREIIEIMDKFHYIDISTATVSSYINLFAKKSPTNKQNVENMKDSKKGDISIPEVKERVFKATELCVVEGKTVPEIAKELKTTEYTIYRDLKKRLPKLNKEASEEVNKILKKHSSESRKKQ